MMTLVINGSPRRDGDTATLVNELVRHLHGNVRYIHPYHDDIGPCLDCRYCWDNPGCCLEDGMQEAYRLITEADNIVFATPLYFSMPTGRMLDFASRLQTYYASRFKRKDTGHAFKHKKAVIILTGGGSTKDIQPALDVSGLVLRSMNAGVIGVVASLKTDAVPAGGDSRAMDDARRMAMALNGPVE